MTYTEQLFSHKTIPSLNGWRAIAVTLVILGHLKLTQPNNSIIYKILDFLIDPGFGVRIFFVLSGFLITTLLIKEKHKTGKINIRNFFIRRFLRIAPVLWLYLIVIAILNQLFRFNLTLLHFLGPLLYVNNFNFFPGIWLVGHTWSLAVEEQFYLIWPFLFKYAKNILYIGLFFILITPIIIIVTYFKPQSSTILLAPFFKPAAAIFTGAVLAFIWSKNFYQININKYLKRFAFYLLILMALLISILRHYFIFGTVLSPGGDTLLNPIICYLIVFSILTERHTPVYKILNHPMVIKIGILSYSIYIWQQLFIIPKGMFSNWGQYFAFPVNILVIAIVAWLSHHYFEQPFLKLKYKFSAIK